MKRDKTQYKPSESGFSLIEAIITIFIFLMVMAAIFGVLRAGNAMRDSVTNRSEITSNARAALGFIGREAVNAGLGYSKTGGVVPDDFAYDLFKIPKDPDSDRDLFPGVLAGNNISASDLSVNGEKNDVIAFIARDLQFNGGDSVSIIKSGEISSNPYLTATAGKCAACKKYDVYLIESPDGKQALAMATAITTDTFITIQYNDPLKLNRKINGIAKDRSILTECGLGETADCMSYTPQATLKRVFITSYSVLKDGTLVRTTYGNNTGATAADQIQVHPLAYGVQSFQVRYLLKNGTMTDDPSSGNTNQMGLNEVVQVEISVTIKSETNSNGVTSTQLINLDSTFSTRNMRYDFE